MSVASTAGSSPTRSDSYKSEIRFGVVMYGGVSLAIYINGVANELYEMASATPKVIRGDAAAKGTREVYRKASLLLGNEDLRKQYAEHLKSPTTVRDPFETLPADAERARFVVDVISGTSAGGINGAFLAKALANGQQFSALKDLWIQEGDIESLLNDDNSYQGLEYAKNDSPTRSLLNSDRMYVKLLDAFQGMQRVAAPIGESESQLADEIDLYMTTTDILGTVVPLRLFDNVAYERRFRQVYHFQYAAAAGRESRNDFADRNSPFLAFAARCTSSFPFAFEPMTVADAERLRKAKLESLGEAKKDVDPRFDEWKPFFTGLSNADLGGDGWRTRAFGDGGYLDNKPFSYAVEALSWRLGNLPMERKLIYVEPVPAHPERERNNRADKPDAIENAFRALNTIPQYETIREDLEAVLSRNRRIERVERIVRQVEADIETREPDPFARLKLIDGKVPDWSSLDLAAMIDYYGVAFLPYRRLRVASVTDDIADRLAIWWGVDRNSDRLYALKAMARVWREANYYENRTAGEVRPASINKFLNDFDIKYRLRRVSFLLRKVHQLRSLAVNWNRSRDRKWMSDIERRLWERLDKRGCPLDSMSHDDLIAALNCMARGLGEVLQELRAAIWPESPALGPRPGETDRAALDQLLGLLLGEVLDPPLKFLPASDGKSTVPVAAEALPPRNRLRTLQENVFARAQALFGLATGASSKTAIQEMLEANMAALRHSYDPSTLSSGRVPLARDLLGDPKLVPVTGDDGQSRVDIEVKDKIGICDGLLDTEAARILRKFLAEYYLRFDEYDQMSFPLYYDTGTGEPSTVEILRVSPEDAHGLIDERIGSGDGRRKLAGTFLFNFGAFLDEQWRRNDIMWGRLDGCERLLAAMFPTTDEADLCPATDDDKETKAIREALLQEAQRAILREEMQPGAYAQLVDGLAKALVEEKKGPLKDAFEAVWKKLAPTESQRATRMAEALRAVMGEEGMFDYVRQRYEVDRKLDTGTTMKTGARALTITGRILEDSERRYRNQSNRRMVWVTRGGRALQALLTVSTPGSSANAIFGHWLVLLYVFEALTVIGGMAFSAPGVRTFGLTCLGVTAVLHIVSKIAGDLMHSKRGWIKLTAAGLAVAVLVLAFLGALALSNVGFRSIMCGDSQDRVAVFRKLCG